VTVGLALEPLGGEAEQLRHCRYICTRCKRSGREALRRGTQDGAWYDWTTRRVRETVLNPYYAGCITVYAERLKGDLDAMN
jgi:hypothetical protein